MRKILDVVDYKYYVDEALRSGKSKIEIRDTFSIKNLRRAVHKYAGKGVLKTSLSSDYHHGCWWNILIIKSKQVIPPTVKTPPYKFKVGDHGFTNCNEPYVVLEKKNNGELLVNIKSKGRWNIGLRKSDGTCVIQYKNGHMYALQPPLDKQPEQPKKQIRTVYLNVYNNCVVGYYNEAEAKDSTCSDSEAVALPITIEFTSK